MEQNATFSMFKFSLILLLYVAEVFCSDISYALRLLFDHVTMLVPRTPTAVSRRAEVIIELNPLRVFTAGMRYSALSVFLSLCMSQNERTWSLISILKEEEGKCGKTVLPP